MTLLLHKHIPVYHTCAELTLFMSTTKNVIHMTTLIILILVEPMVCQLN